MRFIALLFFYPLHDFHIINARQRRRDDSVLRNLILRFEHWLDLRFFFLALMPNDFLTIDQNEQHPTLNKRNVSIDNELMQTHSQITTWNSFVFLPHLFSTSHYPSAIVGDVPHWSSKGTDRDTVFGHPSSSTTSNASFDIFF